MENAGKESFESAQHCHCCHCRVHLQQQQQKQLSLVSIVQAQTLRVPRKDHACVSTRWGLKETKNCQLCLNDDWWFTSGENQAGSNHDGRVGHTFACNFWKSFPDKSVHEAKYFQPLSKFYILLSIPNTYFHSSLMFPAAPPVLYIEKSKSKSKSN